MAVATLERPARYNKKLTLSWDVTTITPDISAEWLGKNVKNRKRSDKTTAQYARDMKAGRWRLTGDPIRFDVNGNLIDGQHRLQACIDADVNFVSAVVYGLQPDDQDVLDSARSRTAADALQIHGHSGSRNLAAMTRLLASLKDGAAVSAIKYSNAEIVRFVEDRPKMITSVGMIWNGLPAGVHAAPLSAVHYLAANVLRKRDDADAFVAVFKTGVPHYEGCAAHGLRERLMRTRDDRRQAISKTDVFRAYIHAWNHFSDRTTITYFRVPKDCTMSGLKIENI